MATREELPDDSILIKGESKIFTEPSEPDNRDKKIKQLRGLLKDHRENYSSVELQKRSSKWRKDVSDSRNS